MNPPPPKYPNWPTHPARPAQEGTWNASIAIFAGGRGGGQGSDELNISSLLFPKANR